MNYYAQGGQTHGLKSLAQELPKYGRYNDDMVAHISSDEAKLLKSMGGSGTINPTTGLPEFGFGNPFKPIQRAIGQLNPLNPGSAVSKAVDSIPVIGEANRAINNLGTQVFQPLEKAIVQPASAGLASFDKMVGNTIPGGWGTVASVAGSAMGLPTPFLVGLGALNGSGVMRKGGSFNLQGAMMGGAMAYGAAELGDYMRGAVPTGGESAFNALPVSEVPTDGISSLYNSTGGFADPSAIPSSAINSANAATAAAQNINPATGLQYGSMLGDTLSGTVPPTPPSIGSQIMSGNFGDALSQVGTNISEGATNAYNSAANFADKAITPSTYTDALSEYGQNVSKTGEGIKNLVGAGDMTAKQASTLASATAKAAGTTSPMMAAGATIYGGMGMAAAEEQRKYLEEAKAANAISQGEYDKAMGEVNRSVEDASKAVRENPFSTTPNRDVSMDPTYYGRGNEIDNLYARMQGEDKLYAVGGSVDDEYGMDEARGLNQGNLQNGFMGSRIPRYAAGGQIDMGNGYNQFANLPNMGGALGNAQNIGPAAPFVNMPRVDSTNTTTQQDMMGGNRNGLSGGLLSMLGATGSTPFSTSNANATQQPLGGLNQLLPAMSSNNQNPNTTPGGFAGPSVYSGGGGGAGGNGGAFPLEGQYGIVKMAAGGMAPRFLSGGGDGMSDSIPANIGGKQEARLADGEFVIPADVVSHLGNGSSKAGAKQLYSMMDKVRTARTGRKSQGKQINPRKFLAA